MPSASAHRLASGRTVSESPEPSTHATSRPIERGPGQLAGRRAVGPRATADGRPVARRRPTLTPTGSVQLGSPNRQWCPQHGPGPWSTCTPRTSPAPGARAAIAAAGSSATTTSTPGAETLPSVETLCPSDFATLRRIRSPARSSGATVIVNSSAPKREASARAVANAAAANDVPSRGNNTWPKLSGGRVSTWSTASAWPINGAAWKRRAGPTLAGNGARPPRSDPKRGAVPRSADDHARAGAGHAMPRMGDRLEALEGDRPLACLAGAVRIVVEAAEGGSMSARASRARSAARRAVSRSRATSSSVAAVIDEASASLCSKLRRWCTSASVSSARSVAIWCLVRGEDANWRWAREVGRCGRHVRPFCVGSSVPAPVSKTIAPSRGVITRYERCTGRASAELDVVRARQVSILDSAKAGAAGHGVANGGGATMPSAPLQQQSSREVRS